MKRSLLRSTAFIRAAKRLVKKRPEIAAEVESALELLEDDAFHPRLRTHKLKGALDGSMACSVGYDLRIVFRIVKHSGSEAVLLESVGTHEEVY